MHVEDPVNLSVNAVYGFHFVIQWETASAGFNLMKHIKLIESF